MPNWRLDVVDRVSSAERLGTFELRITARSNDDACTKHSGELQTEQGNASSTLNKDRVAGFRQEDRAWSVFMAYKQPERSKR